MPSYLLTIACEKIHGRGWAANQRQILRALDSSRLKPSCTRFRDYDALLYFPVAAPTVFEAHGIGTEICRDLEGIVALEDARISNLDVSWTGHG